MQVCRVAEFFDSPVAQRRFPSSKTGRYTNTCILQHVAGHPFTFDGAALPLNYARFDRVYEVPVRNVAVQPTGAVRKLGIEAIGFYANVSKCAEMGAALMLPNATPRH
jgi:hypothetical protein